MRLFRRLTLLCFNALVCASAAAADYPSAPIRLIIGFPPGGGSDTAARIVSEKLALELGQPVVVDNRPGATGNIAVQAVARAAPDGYTMLFGTSEMVINTLTRKKDSVQIDLLKEFIPISEVGNVSFALVVPPNSPVTSVQGLVALASANPGKLNYASFGVAGTNHLMTEMFLYDLGIKATHVPYKGSALAATALMAGEVDFSFDTVGVVLPMIKAGKINALATPSPQRLRDLPNLPTLAEAGIKINRMSVVPAWMGMFAPAGTPAPIVQRFHQALVKVLRMPDIVARLTDRGVRVVGSTPEEFRRKVASELDELPRAVKEAGVSLE